MSNSELYDDADMATSVAGERDLPWYYIHVARYISGHILVFMSKLPFGICYIVSYIVFHLSVSRSAYVLLDCLFLHW